MKRNIICLLVCFMMFLLSFDNARCADGAAAKPAENAKSGLTLKQDTLIKVELSASFSSQSSKSGESVPYKVVEDVVVDGVVVIEEGAEAKGRIVKARPAKGWGKGGILELSVETVEAVDGSKIKLAPAKVGDAQEWSGLKTIGGVALFGLAFGGAMKGKKVELASGTKLEVYVAEDNVIDPNGKAAGGYTAPAAAKSDGSGSVCLTACKDETGDDFKKCMSACDKCKPTCKSLAGDDQALCLSKCM